MPLLIGTSGWQYRHWRGRLYAEGLPASRWFDRYVEAFDTVELNVTFYGQPRPRVFEGWARRAPDHFRFAVKASRFLTHVRRLREPADSVDMLMEGASRLGAHLGPILVQLPPDMKVEASRLGETLEAFPAGVHVAVEARNKSWFTDEVRGLLRAHGAALCWADRRGPLTPVEASWATAGWGYVRFHGGRASPPGCYGPDALDAWAGRLRDAWPRDAEVFAYFNNDRWGCAPRDAVVFARRAERAHLDPSRTPELDEVPVG